jgi:hypothetical protein
MAIPKGGPNTTPAGTRVRGLLIVARGHPDLYHTLQQQFGGSQRVTILLDRRRAERRRELQPVPSDLRRVERRTFPHLQDDLRVRKYVLVRPHYRRPRG